MKAVWTITGGQPLTLGDDKAVPKVTMKLEQIGVHCLEQVENLFQSLTPFRLPRGNVQGDCVFAARKSHADRDTAAKYFLAQTALVNQQGTLVLTIDQVTMTMANAVMRAVVTADLNGLEWTLRYTLGITLIN